MQDMAHSICLIKLYQITIRKNFDFLFLTALSNHFTKKAKFASKLRSSTWSFIKIKRISILEVKSPIPNQRMSLIISSIRFIMFVAHAQKEAFARASYCTVSVLSPLEGNYISFTFIARK